MSSAGHQHADIRWDDLRFARVRQVAGLRPVQDRPNKHRGEGWGVRDYAVNPVSAERLWELSVRLAG